jgi:hypothetical protein
MLRRALILAAPLAISWAHVAAAEAPKAEVGQYVDLSPVGLPIVAKGELVNYVFVYVRINLAGGADTPRWRAKAPYFRDALVRAGHRTPFTRADDYQQIDTDKLSAALMREASAITGAGVVRSVVVTAQTPRRRVGTPRG